jgi:hypothetical protein
MARRKHTVEVINTDVEIDEHLDLHEKGWVAQKAGWLIMFSIMTAGALGFFGNGLLSNHTNAAGDFRVEYQRFWRYETEMKIRVSSNQGDLRTITLSQDYLEKFRVVRFVPEPQDYSAANRMITYRFSSAGNKIINLYLVTKQNGSVSGSLVINDNDIHTLSHFIFP